MSFESRALPGSTYRLQLGPDLHFDDVAAIADYLVELGVTHVYFSPIFQAGHGSTHGYDVTDPREINTELGGLDGFVALCRALHQRGLGVVVDIVPNHMAIPVPETDNPVLAAVLREGAQSPYAPWFDIDWAARGGRILMPVLDGEITANLDNIRVARDEAEPTLAYFDHAFPLAAGSDNVPLPRLLEQQHYELADWRRASTDLNYRRFCDITTLIGVRVEDPAVFEVTHALIGELVNSGHVDGLRVDHPDGLAEPADYLAGLAKLTSSAWVVVEKVLAANEPLPPDWDVAGTTGYESLTAINELLVDPAGEYPLSRTYVDLTEDTSDFATAAVDGRRLVATHVMATEVHRLARLLHDQRVTASGDDTAYVDAIVEVLCRLTVYRPFVSSPVTVDALGDACAAARDRRPDIAPLVDAVRTAALASGEFGVRFAQTAAAIYAKGIEDTAFYRYARLLSLNEVGGDPARFGCSVADFHAFAQRLQRDHPMAMTTLSTHDTKRSEDVRARLAVLSEIPAEWDAVARRLMAASARLGCPDNRTGYVFWQTMVGAWPLDLARATRYMEKATREAKLATSWHAPNLKYDTAVTEFVRRVFDDSGVLDEVARFVDSLRPFAHANSLVQKLIQLTMPGVPDTYQGCELPRFTLVDPDNRGPVDFDERRDALRAWTDEKLRLTAIALRLRRDHRSWFDTYQPMTASGRGAEHLVAFARSPQLIALAARHTARLTREGDWGETSIALPGGTWADALSGRELDGGERRVADVLGRAPVALLVPAVSLTP